MNVRRMPSAPPNNPASNTTLSRGDASPDWDASVMVQSSCANTNAAKSTSWESSTSRSRVDRPGLNVVVQGSTSATSSSPRVIAWSSLACLPDDPRKMRGLFMRGQVLRFGGRLALGLVVLDEQGDRPMRRDLELDYEEVSLMASVSLRVDRNEHAREPQPQSDLADVDCNDSRRRP